eukprot:SAG22_NODE_901_length_6600_cov_1.945854_2_plen_348_part_00
MRPCPTCRLPCHAQCQRASACAARVRHPPVWCPARLLRPHAREGSSSTHAAAATAADHDAPAAAASAAPAPRPAPPPLPAAARRQQLLAQLIGMGFPVHNAERALDEKGNYLGAAIEYASAMPGAAGSEPAPAAAAAAGAPARAASVPRAAAAGGPSQCGPSQACPFPIMFAVAILSAGRDQAAPRHDLEQLGVLAAAAHGRQCREHARELGLGAPPELLGLAELIAEQILLHGRTPKPAGQRGYEFPQLPAAVQERLVGAALAEHAQLQEQLGVHEPFISMYAERPALEELHHRARWPVFAYKARLAPLGHPVGLIAMDSRERVEAGETLWQHILDRRGQQTSMAA